MTENLLALIGVTFITVAVGGLAAVAVSPVVGLLVAVLFVGLVLVVAAFALHTQTDPEPADAEASA